MVILFIVHDKHVHKQIALCGWNGSTISITLFALLYLYTLTLGSSINVASSVTVDCTEDFILIKFGCVNVT